MEKEKIDSGLEYNTILDQFKVIEEITRVMERISDNKDISEWGDIEQDLLQVLKMPFDETKFPRLAKEEPYILEARKAVVSTIVEYSYLKEISTKIPIEKTALRLIKEYFNIQ